MYTLYTHRQFYICLYDSVVALPLEASKTLLQPSSSDTQQQVTLEFHGGNRKVPDFELPST